MRICVYATEPKKSQPDRVFLRYRLVKYQENTDRYQTKIPNRDATLEKMILGTKMLWYYVTSATYVPSMTPVTFWGELVLPPVKPNTF
jgi:hypothetical protein